MPLLASQLTEQELEQLQSDPRVKSVHANDAVRPQAAPALTTQQAAPWNLNRIAQPDLPLDGLYKYASDGTGVRVYVLDTVRPSATEGAVSVCAPQQLLRPCRPRESPSHLS